LKVEGAAELKKLREAVQADKDVLAMLNTKCRDLDNVFAARNKDRDQEIKAVDTALEILTSDENRDALHPSFFQVASSEDRRQRERAAEYLTDAARSTPSWEQVSYDMLAMDGGHKQNQVNRKLILAAQKTKLRDFSEVIAMIDKMVADIKKQSADDIAKRDTCNTDLAATAKSIRETKREQDLTVNAIAETEETIEEKKQEKADLLSKIAETKESILEASQTREEENEANQQSITEAREMNAVLNKALTVLKTQFQKEGLMQVRQDPGAGQVTAMPGDFEEYRSNQGANGVLTMMEKIVGDVKKTEEDTMADEAKSQAEYEEFVKDANASVKADEGAVGDLLQVIANEQSELNDLKTQSADLDTDLKDLAGTETSLHNDCDFLIKYFSDRQSAMQNEIESLGKAKAFLKGMGK